VNDVVESTRKEAFVAYFMFLLQNLHVRNGGNCEERRSGQSASGPRNEPGTSRTLFTEQRGPASYVTYRCMSTIMIPSSTYLPTAYFKVTLLNGKIRTEHPNAKQGH